MQHNQTGFRRDGQQAHDWCRWVSANRSLITEVGIPADVVATRQEFEYLLQHGYNRAGWWNEQPWFEIASARSHKQAQFWVLLQSYVTAFYAAADRERELQILAHSFRSDGGPA